jgi:hypothetical protein
MAMDVSDLKGLWRRSLMIWPDGRRDSTTQVRWLQGFGMYGDLRQPPSMHDFSHARGLADLSLTDCSTLALQQGFAGRLGFDGSHFEWARQIDFQPTSSLPDAGRLCWEAGVLVERGRDLPYIEHWHRDAAAATAPCAALALREHRRETAAILLRVGESFVFARDRAAPLPQHRTLSECIDAAPSLQCARSLIDCEISIGCIAPEGFLITDCTLPYRLGDVLGQQRQKDVLMTSDRNPDGATTTRVWDIIEYEGDMAAL